MPQSIQQHQALSNDACTYVCTWDYNLLENQPLAKHSTFIGQVCNITTNMALEITELRME